ncbi:monocopper oxidase-like protein SKS2 [Sesamum indicum]|uniref:Monocopper oxidase-like protein SKS2 n=1 Tax=Sesamum indicum TaxID=4182 RepID=A0A6I9TSY6_SESIN|nr:monocopper oxidase-like protein SKS2 [Sesamum indicum]
MIIMISRKHRHHETAALRLGMWWLACCVMALSSAVQGEEIFLEWHVKIDNTIKPVSVNQPVITINDLFPGPLINATTNDNVHVNVYNDMDEPLLMTWNGIQQRLNSWQDGVSGTNCPIRPGTNWTYVFQLKDQIGGFHYFPTINFQRAGGGFGPIRINNRIVINVPFPKPEQEFDLLIGDWYGLSFKKVRVTWGADYFPDWILMNGKGPYHSPFSEAHESFNVSRGKTYRFRISNVGNLWSINFRIQNHKMLLVETEGSYTNQITLDSLDVHVGQSYSVLVTADQYPADYYIVATPKWVNLTKPNAIAAVGLLHYDNSTESVNGPLPNGPDPFDIDFSLNQAQAITLNMSTGGARPNPQGSFNVTNVTLSQTFLLRGSLAVIDGYPRYTVNNVTYVTPSTPLKLADQFLNGSGVYELDAFPIHSSLPAPVNGTFVVSGTHKGWLEIVFKNDLDMIDSWHLDGFGFFVVGFGLGEWTPEARSTMYNFDDPVVRSTVQVYPGGWTAVYVYLDNPGMWNLRSQNLRHWYLGQELYIRVYDPDPNPAKERSPPNNLLFCGAVQAPPPPPPSLPLPSPPPPKAVPVPSPPSSAAVKTSHIGWLYVVISCSFVLLSSGVQINAS